MWSPKESGPYREIRRSSQVTLLVPWKASGGGSGRVRAYAAYASQAALALLVIETISRTLQRHEHHLDFLGPGLTSSTGLPGLPGNAAFTGFDRGRREFVLQSGLTFGVFHL
jgi:hypothetical protein